ncbi:MAG: hypothetical protein RMY62_013480 [Nostoc sp. ZfuVER08]|nr:hypothetical protein [Nostoc sp. ZfuVER08]
MKVIVQVVEKVYQEAHIEVPDFLSEEAIKQYIVDRYNSGKIAVDLNIFQVDFESISATIVHNQNSVDVEEEAV